MSDSYVDAKILEALKATNNDERDAQKLVITWAVRDQALLIGLSKPHLKTLVKTKIDELNRKSKKGKVKDIPPEIKKMVVSPSKGEKRSPVKAPPHHASKRHVSVMNQIVAAFKKKA
ncbi:MAG: hypothetical protein RBT70_05295 [Alphaproteobacteria bacterium]|jgi:hypothetical protein|nr:hypothetical protein [Alphaproteobacteria bacterium]